MGSSYFIPTSRDTGVMKGLFNPFTAEFSDALCNASEKPLYQISHTIYLLETIHKIVPYGLAKPKTFLD